MRSLVLFKSTVWIAVIVLFQLVHSSIVKLNHTYHLIELTTTRSNVQYAGTNYDDFVQPFNDLVIGEDACLKSSPPSEIYNFDLSAQPIIYSDANMTLSFLLEISFQALDLSVFPSVKGYQISIDMNDGRGHATTTCLQIIPMPGQIPSEFYKLRIKDPSFVSIFNQSYAFYFGQVQVQAISCDPVNVLDSSKHAAKSFGALNSSVWSHCVATGPKSVLISAGIKKSNPSVDVTKPVDARLCGPNMNNLTCVKRLTKNSYVLFHPMPEQFDSVVARLYNAPPDPDDTSKYRRFRPKIESLPNQKWENNLVFKLVKLGDMQKDLGADVSPLILFDAPNDKNTCGGNLENMCYSCSKDEAELVNLKEPTCTRCSQINSEDGIEDEDVSYQKLDVMEGGKLSTHYCDKLPNNVSKAYDFLNVPLETRFLGQDLNFKWPSEENTKKSDLTHNVVGFFPAFCISKGSKKGSFKIEFNDAKRIAFSSILADSVYQFRLFSVKLDIDPTKTEIEIAKIPANLVLNRTTDLSEIDDLKLAEGEYLVELSVKMNSSLGSDRCLMQTNTKNHFRAVDCPTFYGRFGLKSMALENISTRDKAVYHLDSKDTKACSKYSARLYKSLEYSFQAQTEGRPGKLESYLEKNVDRSKQSLPSTVVENSFTWHGSLKVLHLKTSSNYIHFDLQEPKSNRGFPATTTLLAATLVSACLLLVLVQVLYTLAKSAFDYRSQRKLIVCYTPVFVDAKVQYSFDYLVNCFRTSLNRYFKNIAIEFVDLHTSPEQKHELLKSCDLILFVIADPDHRQPVNLDQLPPIGQSAYQFDFDLIHRVEQYQTKCVDITFNQSLKPDGRLFKFPEQTMRLVSIISNVESFKRNITNRYSTFFMLKRASQHLASCLEVGLRETSSIVYSRESFKTMHEVTFT